MKIRFVNEHAKGSKYIEFLPAVTYSWHGGEKTICLGWLYFFIFIDL